MSKATNCVYILFLLVVSSWELRIDVGGKYINLKGQSGNKNSGEDANSVNAWTQVMKDYKEDSKQGAHGDNKTDVSQDANSTHFWRTFFADAHEDSSQKPAKVAMKNGKLMNIPQDAVEDMMSKMVLTKIKNDFIEDKKQVESQIKSQMSNGSTTVSHLSTGSERQEQHEKEVLAQQLAQKEIVKRKMSLALEHLSSQVSQNSYNSNSLGPKSPFSSLIAASSSQGHLVHHNDAKNQP